MKKYFLAFLIVALSLPVFAQQEAKQKKGHHNVAELVSNLSANQKRQIEAIYDDSKKKMQSLRSEQSAVRDSVKQYLHGEGDNSRILFPLFDREAAIQSQISREMYSTKLKIDEILTPEQRAELKNKKCDKFKHGKPQCDKPKGSKCDKRKCDNPNCEKRKCEKRNTDNK